MINTLGNTQESAHSCQEHCQWIADYLKKKFTEHPAQSGQTWGRHCIDAICYSGQALAACGAFFVYAFAPFWFQGWGGDQIEALNATIKAKRQNRQIVRQDAGDSHPLSNSVHEKNN